MAEDGAVAQQPVFLIGVKIVARMGDKFAHPCDFVDLFAEMGLHQAVGPFRPKRPQGGQLFRR